MKRIIVFGICITMLSGCSPLETVESIESKKGTTAVEITAAQNANKIIFEENGKLVLMSGTIKEIFSFLPGYKKIPVDTEAVKAEMEQIFEYLENAEKKIGDSPLPLLDGAGLVIYYDDEGQNSLKIYSAYDNNTVMVCTSGEGTRYSEILVSEEVYRLVHELSGWKSFDLGEMDQIDVMTAQIVGGYQASDLVVTFSEEETKALIEKIVRSAEVSVEGGCGYNVLINLYKNEVLLYQGYLAGDSCTEIGFESQYFHIDREVVEEIYRKMNYDMTVGSGKRKA